jgi:hypothetical protein
MAATLTWANGTFDPFTRDQASLSKKTTFAQVGSDATEAQRTTAQNELMNLPDFKAEIQATTDTSDLEALDLTSEGVTFPARTIREIRGKSWCLTDNDTYFYEWVENVLGGATPVLLGQKIRGGWAEEAGTASEYGNVHFAATITALTTITTIFASKGYALGDISSGKAALTVPPNRLLLVKNATLDAVVVSATAAGNLVFIDHTNLDGLGTGTDGVQFIAMDAATTDALTDDPKVGTRLDLAFEVWPPHNHRLVMDTANVTVKCVGTNNAGDDNLKHYVEIFVGPARTIGYSAV